MQTLAACLQKIRAPTWNGEGVGLGLGQDTDSLLPLFAGGEALGIHGLRVQMVLHDIGDAHVSVHKPQLLESLVQRGQHLSTAWGNTSV